MTFQSTLPRRERRIKAWRSSSANRFQSTLPRRERLILTLFLPEIGIFQSTLPRRERLLTASASSSSFDFNPHSHEGSDGESPYLQRLLQNFNPHSHEGSDISKERKGDMSYISIHTPTKGATPLDQVIVMALKISIHTPTKGATAILTNNFLIFCSISLINFILYLQIIQILFIFRYKFIFYFIF